MILAEITDNHRIELSKLKGADPELLADICQDGWTLTFHNYIVLALLTHVIAPRLAYERFRHESTKGTDHRRSVSDNIFVTVTGLWYHDDLLYAVGEISAIGIPDLIASCTVSLNMKCESWDHPMITPGADDIDLYPACLRLGKNKRLEWIVPREKIDQWLS